MSSAIGTSKIPAGAVGADGEMQLIASGSASNDANIDFTSLGSYHTLRLDVEGVQPATDDVFLTLEMIESGGTYGASNAYNSFFSGRRTGLGQTTSSLLAQSNFQIMGLTGEGIGNATNEEGAGSIYIYNPQDANSVLAIAGLVSYRLASETSGFVGQVAGVRNTQDAFVEMRLAMSSGNINKGEFKLYGMT